MKLAITLIIIGGFLLVEGGSRILLGIIGEHFFLAMGGVLSGVFLGGFLLYKGIRRYGRIKGESITKPK